MITFYINENHKPLALENFILNLPSDVYIHCNDLEQAKRISEMLWSYPDRFIPNDISTNLPSHIIAIGYQTPIQRQHIINVSDTLLELPHIEWVTHNVDKARDRYRQYKQKGYSLDTTIL